MKTIFTIFVAIALFLIIPSISSAATVTTFATLTSNSFYGPYATVFDAAGNLYVANKSGNYIDKVTPSGTVSSFAYVDAYPSGLVIDTAGNLYTVSYYGTVSKITPSGTVSALAVLPGHPNAIAIDPAGNLYVATWQYGPYPSSASTNGTITKITPSGTVSAFATVGVMPMALAFDTTGNLYTVNNNDYNNTQALGTISKVTPFDCSNGTVQDADGNTYNTVVIGTQCWMASNLKVGTKLDSAATLPSNNGLKEKWCYNNDDAICATDGGLYSWNEAMQYSTIESAQGICSAGWHIPTDSELYALENYLKDVSPCESDRTPSSPNTAWQCSSAGTKLKIGGSSGMNFPLAGDKNGTSNVFESRTGFQLFGYFWSSTMLGGTAYSRALTSIPTMPAVGGAVGRFYSLQSQGFSVRCVKDNGLPAQTTTFATVDMLPNALAFDPAGNLYVANSSTLKKITPSGTVTTIPPSFFGNPDSLAFDSVGNLYVGMASAGYLKKVTPSGIVDSYFAYIGAGQQALAFDTAGSLYIVIPGSSRATINKISSSIRVSSNISSASWTITGPATITGSGTYQSTLGKPSGTYTITWGAASVSGYIKPATESLTLDSLGDISFSGIYTCATNYTWNGSSCVANTRAYTCSAKPATGTNWNTVSSYSQAWNGSIWFPADDATTEYNATASDASCPSGVQDVDGNTYNTVVIGNQCWMSENLRTTKKPDGTSLTEGSGMYSNPAGSGSPWGKLYDWNTAMNGVSAATTIGAEIQGICPTGWHIPSDYNTDPSDDWQKLADFLGGYQVAGGKMKRTEIPLYWNVPNGGPFGDNSSGFSGVAAGFWQNGIFYNRGYYAFFLSSSEYTATAILNRVLFTDGTVFVFDPNKPKTIGYSVRCVKDLPLSVSSCRYACATNYTWNGSSCVANTQTYTCAAKPATGTNWNTVSSYSQTWNGSAWTPANSATAYNTTADTNSCRYTCAADYLWDSSACVLDNNCEASTSVCSTCWNNAAWVNGTVSCSTACTGPSGSQICAVDNGCAATTPIGQICWNSYEWVNGTYNTPPAVSGMTAPNWNYTQASANALRANLQFSFVDPDAGSYGSAYQVIIKKADDTPVLDTGVCTGYNTPSAKCKVDPTNCMENGSTGCINPGDCVCTYALDSAFLGYSQGYKWSVQVWDNHSAASTLTPYNSGSDTDNNDGSASTFTAYKHNMPIAGFTHSPDQPSKGEAAKFTNASQVYLSSAPNTAVNCTTGQCTYFWTATAGASINDTATTSPIITFNSNSNSTVTLKVTDNDGYYISVSDVININAQLPNWKEVKPE